MGAHWSNFRGGGKVSSKKVSKYYKLNKRLILFEYAKDT